MLGISIRSIANNKLVMLKRKKITDSYILLYYALKIIINVIGILPLNLKSQIHFFRMCISRTMLSS